MSAQNLITQRDVVKHPQFDDEGITPSTYGITKVNPAFQEAGRDGTLVESPSPTKAELRVSGQIDKLRNDLTREVNTVALTFKVTEADKALLQWLANPPNGVGTADESRTFLFSYKNNIGIETFQQFLGCQPLDHTITQDNEGYVMCEATLTCKEIKEDEAGPTIGTGSFASDDPGGILTFSGLPTGTTYTVGEDIILAPPIGGGLTARATATISAGGIITNLVITFKGSGYALSEGVDIDGVTSGPGDGQITVVTISSERPPLTHKDSGATPFLYNSLNREVENFTLSVAFTYAEQNSISSTRKLYSKPTQRVITGSAIIFKENLDIQKDAKEVVERFAEFLLKSTPTVIQYNFAGFLFLPSGEEMSGDTTEATKENKSFEVNTLLLI